MESTYRRTVNVMLKSLQLSLDGICPVHVLEENCDMMNGLYQGELGSDEPRSHVNQAGVIVYREEEQVMVLAGLCHMR